MNNVYCITINCDAIVSKRTIMQFLQIKKKLKCSYFKHTLYYCNTQLFINLIVSSYSLRLFNILHFFFCFQFFFIIINIIYQINNFYCMSIICNVVSLFVLNLLIFTIINYVYYCSIFTLLFVVLCCKYYFRLFLFIILYVFINAPNNFLLMFMRMFIYCLATYRLYVHIICLPSASWLVKLFKFVILLGPNQENCT